MKIETAAQAVHAVVPRGPLPKATLYEIIDELESRAEVLDHSDVGVVSREPSRHIRSAIDELRIACSMIVAIQDANARNSS